MTRVRIELDHAGIGAILREECAPAVLELAKQIAGNVDAQGLVAAGGWDRFGIQPEITATVRMGVTDRARAVVEIEHPAALAMEAKHGVLTKAAGQAGVELRGAR